MATLTTQFNPIESWKIAWDGASSSRSVRGRCVIAGLVLANLIHWVLESTEANCAYHPSGQYDQEGSSLA